MSNHNPKQIEEILAGFKFKSFAGSLADCIESIHEHDGKTHITIGCQKERLPEFQQLADAATKKLEEVEGAYKIILTNAKATLKGVKGVNKVIMIASGKGGVGKSTVAFHLALSLAKGGKKVGLVDVDIYGPSLPSLTGITRKPILEGNLMIPHQKFGLKLMSVGFLVDGQEALIWRGPMATKMLYQLIRLTDWSNDGEGLDYLIIDTPPGTGDVHLSLAENYQIDGAIVVSTPQDLAIADVTRALTMFKKLDIPVFGIVENYSYLEIDGHKHYAFGNSKANIKLAKKFGTKLIAEIPINSELTDIKSIVYHKPESAIAQIFTEIAKVL